MKYIAVVCVVVFALLGVAFGLKDPVCGLPQVDIGYYGCLDKSGLKYSYNAGSNGCLGFYFLGCGGNANRFKSLRECEAKCKE